MRLITPSIACILVLEQMEEPYSVPNVDELLENKRNLLTQSRSPEPYKSVNTGWDPLMLANCTTYSVPLVCSRKEITTWATKKTKNAGLVHACSDACLYSLAIWFLLKRLKLSLSASRKSSSCFIWGIVISKGLPLYNDSAGKAAASPSASVASLLGEEKDAQGLPRAGVLIAWDLSDAWWRSGGLT